MKTMPTKNAKHGFGRLIDLAHAESVMIEKHWRAVVVVMAVEEYERLKALDVPATARVRTKRVKE